MAISRALMERQLRKGGGMMNAVPRQQYGLGSFVRSITKPVSKIADKFIPNEITRTINKIPAPVRTAAMFIPGVGQYMALANAASTLARSQGRGLSLGDIANLGLSYYAAGKSGVKLPGGADLPGFTGEEFTAFDGIMGVSDIDPNTGLPSGVEASEGALSTTPVVTKPVVTAADATTTTYTPNKFAGVKLETGTDVSPMESFYTGSAPGGPAAPISSPSSATVSGGIDFETQIPEVAGKGYADQFAIEQAKELGEVGIKKAYETAGGGFEGIKAASKEAAADFLGVPEFKDIASAVQNKDAVDALIATKDLITKNPGLVIGSTSLMAYLTTPEPLPGESLIDFENRKDEVNSYIARYSNQLDSSVTNFDTASDFYDRYRSNLGYAEGGRAGRAFGGIMDIPMGKPRDNGAGITELDYRQDGGFVPIGIKEKADDVPAMLSKNEFVMTADAVRGAGNGDIEKGAQKMYDTMKQLESRVV